MSYIQPTLEGPTPQFYALISPMTDPNLLMQALGGGIRSVLERESLPTQILEAVSTPISQWNLDLDFEVIGTPQTALSITALENLTEFADHLKRAEKVNNPTGFLIEGGAMNDLKEFGIAEYMLSKLGQLFGREITSVEHFADQVGGSASRLTSPACVLVSELGYGNRIDRLKAGIGIHSKGLNGPKIQEFSASYITTQMDRRLSHGLAHTRPDVISDVILSAMGWSKLLHELRTCEDLF